MDVVEALYDIDLGVFRALNQAGSNMVLDDLMILLTTLGGLVIVLICVPLWFKSKREAAFDAVVIVAVVTVLTEILKFLVDRPRPFMVLEDVHRLVSASDPSFPSAHASRAFAVAALVALNARRSWGVSAFGLAALIALSRVYLGVHWPSDILAGALLGIATTIAIERFAKRSKLYHESREWVLSRIKSIRRKKGTSDPSS